MIVHIDHESAIPPYEQLRAQIAASIVAGRLPEGHQLPPIRQLAKDLDLAPGTVARAYRALETAGLVRSGGRRGTSVAPARAASARDGRLLAAAYTFAEVAREMRADPNEALAVVRAALVAGQRPDQASHGEPPAELPAGEAEPATETGRSTH